MPRTKTTRNSFGSIFPSKIKRNGKTITVYDARKRYHDAEGKPRQKFKRCLTHADAMLALANFQNEITAQLSASIAPVDHTLGELIDYFQAEYVKPAVIAHGRQISGYRQSLDTIRTILAQQRAYFGESTRLREFTYEQIRLYAERIATTPTRRKMLPAVSTVNQKLSFLRTVLNVAIQLGWIDVSPFRRGKPLIRKSAEARRNRMLTFDEEVRLLDACTGRLEYLRAWIICALDTAMRRGDIWNLRWRDVDLENRVIYIDVNDGDEFRSKTGVGGVLPVTPRLLSELREKKRTAGRLVPNDLVFGRIDIKKGWAKICSNAGIENLQFKDCRSTGATRFLLAGNSNALVRKITRHTNDEMLIANYTNIDIENAHLIGEKLAEFNEYQIQKVKDKANEQKAAA